MTLKGAAAMTAEQEKRLREAMKNMTDKELAELTRQAQGLSSRAAYFTRSTRALKISTGH